MREVYSIRGIFPRASAVRDRVLDSALAVVPELEFDTVILALEELDDLLALIARGRALS